MRLNAGHLEHARRVADAILYEGYLLYPYHKEARKNQVRFQFGVLMPPAYSKIDPCELSASQTECLLEQQVAKPGSRRAVSSGHRMPDHTV